MYNLRDTVASVGLSSKTLPFYKSNPSIRLFRHALALDVRRIKFTPLYYKPAGEQASALEVWFSGCHGGTLYYVSRRFMCVDDMTL